MSGRGRQPHVNARSVARDRRRSDGEFADWAKKNPVFATPTPAEGAFVAKIYAVAHFQQNIEQKKLLRGGKVADPFVIARAACEKESS